MATKRSSSDDGPQDVAPKKAKPSPSLNHWFDPKFVLTKEEFADTVENLASQIDTSWIPEDIRATLHRRFFDCVDSIVSDVYKYPDIKDAPGWKALFKVLDFEDAFQVWLSGLSPAGVQARSSEAPLSLDDLIRGAESRPPWAEGVELDELVGEYMKARRNPHPGPRKAYIGTTCRVASSQTGFPKRFSEHAANLEKTSGDAFHHYFHKTMTDEHGSIDEELALFPMWFFPGTVTDMRCDIDLWQVGVIMCQLFEELDQLYFGVRVGRGSVAWPGHDLPYDGCCFSSPIAEVLKASFSDLPKGVASGNFECPDEDCGFEGKSVAAVRSHFKQVHDGTFACWWEGCSDCLSSMWALTGHVNRIHLNSGITCTEGECTEWVRTETAFLHHLLDEHGIDQFAKICECGVRCWKAQHYIMHWKTCSLNEDEVQMFFCEFCSKAYRQSSTCIAHQRSCDANPEPETFDCRYCHSGFVATTSRTTHERYCTLNDERIDKPYSCRFCDATLLRKGTHYMHELACKSNPDRKTFNCTFCGESYSSQGSLRIHSKICGSNPDKEEKKWPCRWCHREFDSLGGCTMHEHACENNPSAVDTTCQFCMKKMSTKKNKENHEPGCDKNPSRQLWPCVHCGGTNATDAARKWHEKFCHQNPNRVSNIACRHCSKKISAQNIKKHEQACPSNPDFKKPVCKYCSKEMSPTTIRTHEAKCQGNPNREEFPCPDCDRIFYSAAGLNKHGKSHQ